MVAASTIAHISKNNAERINSIISQVSVMFRLAAERALENDIRD